MLHHSQPTKPVSGSALPAETKSLLNECKDAKQQTPSPALLGIRDLEALASDYVDAREFVESKSSILANPSTFFDFRLSAKKILQHAVYGEKGQVETMLKQNPLLLLEKGTVIDYSGRTHEQRTVYQLALGAVDCDVISTKGSKVVDGMIEMIEEYFKKLPFIYKEIEKIKNAQYDGQFPAGQKEIEDSRINNDSVALNTVISIIASSSDADCKATNELEDKIHDIIRKEKNCQGKPTQQAINLKKVTESILKANIPKKFEMAFQQLEVYLQAKGLIPRKHFDFNILKAIYQFRNHLEPKVAMTSGKHFNHKLLDEAAELYDANFTNFGANIPNQPYWAPKNVICWQKVFGYIERFIPACDGQVIGQGPDSVLEGEKSNRSLTFTYGGSIFPLDSDSDWESGYNCDGEHSLASWRGHVGSHFKTYVEQKHQRSQSYAAARQSTNEGLECNAIVARR